MAWYFVSLPARISARFRLIYDLLVRKYGFDEFYERFVAAGTRGIGTLLWRVGDETLIDGLAVNGTARAVGWISAIVRHVQSGFLYHYAFAMIIGLLVLLGMFVHN